MVPRNSHSPSRGGSASRPPLPGSSPPDRRSLGGRLPPPCVPATGTCSRVLTTRRSVLRGELAGRLVLHDEVLRLVRVAVLEGPAVDLRDGTRPVAVRRR